jgi:hypothetical protein
MRQEKPGAEVVSRVIQRAMETLKPKVRIRRVFKVVEAEN